MSPKCEAVSVAAETLSNSISSHKLIEDEDSINYTNEEERGASKLQMDTEKLEHWLSKDKTATMVKLKLASYGYYGKSATESAKYTEKYSTRSPDRRSETM
ncbi:Hypothetical protein PHPALM_15691, partial [Phytophthora palmivora]